jgi:hypothetical protein
MQELIDAVADRTGDSKARYWRSNQRNAGRHHARGTDRP